MDESTAIIEGFPEIESLDRCVEVVTAFAIENKTAVFHIYNSVSRDVYEHYLRHVCHHVVTKYLDTAFGDAQISEEDREIGIHMIECLLFGLVIDWLDHGMDADAPKDIKRVCELCKGIPEEIIKRSAKSI